MGTMKTNHLTVRELIELLQKMPPEAHVNYPNHEIDQKEPVVNAVLRTRAGFPPEWRYHVDLV